MREGVYSSALILLIVLLAMRWLDLPRKRHRAQPPTHSEMEEAAREDFIQRMSALDRQVIRQVLRNATSDQPETVPADDEELPAEASSRDRPVSAAETFRAA